jgi:hypothetical protein
MKYYWEIIADNLKKPGWSLGYVSAVDSEGQTIWIADAHRGDGKHFVMRADEILTAFLELESAICECIRASNDESTSAAWFAPIWTALWLRCQQSLFWDSDRHQHANSTNSRGSANTAK